MKLLQLLKGEEEEGDFSAPINNIKKLAIAANEGGTNFHERSDGHFFIELPKNRAPAVS